MPAILATKAKQNFGKVLDDVSRGETYTVFRRNKPVARIVPITQSSSRETFGALASYADPTKIPLEQDAFASAIEDKHGHR